MRSYDLILLDADSTLFDFDRAEHEALKRALLQRGHLFTPQAWPPIYPPYGITPAHIPTPPPTGPRLPWNATYR